MKDLITCVLLVDDDPDDNFIHQLVIRDWGRCQTVRVAESGPAALAYLQATKAEHYVRPEVILLDINMPGMNGFEFLEAYHNLPQPLKSDIVLMMLTTSLNPADTDRAGQFGEVTGYRPKPLTHAMLDELLTAHFA